MTNTNEVVSARFSRNSYIEIIGLVSNAVMSFSMSTDPRKGDAGLCFPFHIAQWHVLLVGSLRPLVEKASAMRLFISKINTITLEYL